MSNLEFLREWQKDLIEQTEGENSEEEAKVILAMLDRINRAIETEVKSENETKRIEMEYKRSKFQLFGSIIEGVCRLGGSVLNARASYINVGRILHAESNDLLPKSMATKYVPNARI